MGCLLRERRVLRWRGGLERIEGFCLLADCCQIEWSEEIGRENRVEWGVFKPVFGLAMDLV